MSENEGAGTAVAEAPGTQVAESGEERLNRFLEDAIEKSELPMNINPARIVKSAAIACRKNPDLLKADRTSLMIAMIEAGQDGLEVDGVMAALIPRWSKKLNDTEVQYMRMYRGLIELGRRADDVADIWADVIYDCDQYSVERGANPRLFHVPDLNRPEDAKIVAAYAVAVFTDSRAPRFEVANLKRIQRARAASTAQTGPWGTDFDAMARKTAVRELMKWLRLTPEARAALLMEDEREAGAALSAPEASVAAAREELAASAFTREAIPPPPPEDPDAPEPVPDEVDYEEEAEAEEDEIDFREHPAPTVKALKDALARTSSVDDLDKMMQVEKRGPNRRSAAVAINDRLRDVVNHAPEPDPEPDEEENDGLAAEALLAELEESYNEQMKIHKPHWVEKPEYRKSFVHSIIGTDEPTTADHFKALIRYFQRGKR